MTPPVLRTFTVQTSHLFDVPVVVTGTHPRCILCLAGQTDSFTAPHFLAHLATDADVAGWSLVQMQFSSCLVGAGATITDHEDVDAALGILSSEAWGMHEVCLLATSTGVQVALKVMEGGKNVSVVSRVVLHGVVAPPLRVDPDAAPPPPRYTKELQDMFAHGRYHEIVSSYDVPITACRLAWSPKVTLQEAVWTDAAQGRVGELATTLLPIHVPLMLLCCLQGGYTLPIDGYRGVEGVVRDAASTTEVDVAFFVGAADEQRRPLRVRGAEFSGRVTTFLTVQDERRHIRQKDEAERQLVHKRRSSIGADVFMLR